MTCGGAGLALAVRVAQHEGLSTMMSLRWHRLPRRAHLVPDRTKAAKSLLCWDVAGAQLMRQLLRLGRHRENAESTAPQAPRSSSGRAA